VRGWNRIDADPPYGRFVQVDGIFGWDRSMVFINTVIYWGGQLVQYGLSRNPIQCLLHLSAKVVWPPCEESSILLNSSTLKDFFLH
jgi:hypothetical protein